MHSKKLEVAQYWHRANPVSSRYQAPSAFLCCSIDLSPHDRCGPGSTNHIQGRMKGEINESSLTNWVWSFLSSKWHLSQNLPLSYPKWPNWLEFWQMAILNWKGGWEMEYTPTRKKALRMCVGQPSSGVCHSSPPCGISVRKATWNSERIHGASYVNINSVTSALTFLWNLSSLGWKKTDLVLFPYYISLLLMM